MSLLREKPDKLIIDQLIMEVVKTTLQKITVYQVDPTIHYSLKRNHLATIERAKEYIATRFSSDISLMEIAAHSFVSPFHFSRIFKTFTSCSPHQFLIGVRLRHAEMLLHTSSLPVADIAFSSGFNSVEHFTAMFRAKYHCPPAAFRIRKEVA